MDKSQQHDIKLIQLGSYVRPEVKEYYGRKWVLNGAKNSYPQYVIDRRIGSPTNGSIIEVFSELLYGKGLSVKDSDECKRLKGIIYELSYQIDDPIICKKCYKFYDVMSYKMDTITCGVCYTIVCNHCEKHEMCEICKCTVCTGCWTDNNTVCEGCM